MRDVIYYAEVVRHRGDDREICLCVIYARPNAGTQRTPTYSLTRTHARSHTHTHTHKVRPPPGVSALFGGRGGIHVMLYNVK